MSRAIVTFEATETGDWKPVTVFMGSRTRLQGKTLPGDPSREAWVAEILRTARPPSGSDGTTGTYEDWIGYAVGDVERGWTGALANGHTTWAAEVKPELSIDALFQREVLRIKPKALTRPDLQPTTEAPDNLGGYKKVKP